MGEKKRGVSYLKKKKEETTIRSSAAEYLTYVASIGDQQDSMEMRHEAPGWQWDALHSLSDPGLP